MAQIRPRLRPRTAQRSGRLLAGAALLGLLLAAAAGAPLLSPYDPLATDLSRSLAPPSLAHPAGTDQFGRDLLARLLWGGRRSLGLALGATTLAMLAGAALGALAGLAARWLDLLLAALIDLLLTVPGFLLALAIAAIRGPSAGSLALAIGLAYLPRVALAARAAALAARAAPHVEAARAIGVTPAGILWRAVLPGMLPPLSAVAGGVAGSAILAEAGLSFLGIGVQPPAPSWGAIAADGGQVLQSHPWIALGAGLCVGAAVAAVNLIGDGLLDLLDPQGPARPPG